MLEAPLPSLWRTELSDNILIWTKFGLIVLLLNLLLPHCSRNKNRRNSLSSDYDPPAEMRVLEEHKHSSWLWIIVLLQTQSTDIIACPGELSSWMSVQLEHVKAFPVSTCWWTSIIHTNLLTGTPRGCINHSNPARPLAFDLTCKQRIEYVAANTTAFAFLTVILIFPFKDNYL